MVQIIEGNNSYADIGEKLGTGLVQGYTGRADQMALQKTIEGLDKNASPQEIIKAITGTKVYNPQYRNEFAKTYLGANELSEERRARKVTEEQENRRLDIAAGKAKKDEEEEQRKRAQEITDNEITLRDIYSEDLSSGKKTEEDIKRLATETSAVNNRALAANKTKKEQESFKQAEAVHNDKKKVIEKIDENAEKAAGSLPFTEATLLNTESYTSPEKIWDTVLDATSFPILAPLKSRKGQQIEAYTPVSVAEFSSGMGGVLSVARQRLIEKKAVAFGRDKYANRMLLFMEIYKKKLAELQSQFTHEILAENKYGFADKDFETKLNAKMKPYREMINSDMAQLINDKWPTSKMSKLSVIENARQDLAENEVLVIDKDGNTGALDKSLLGTPGYEAYQQL